MTAYGRFHWGVVATPAQLPNVAAATQQSSYLTVGHTCYVTSTAGLYTCQVSTLGAAVWYQMGVAGGGGPPTGAAGGDLNGAYPNPSVDGLQTVPVSAVTPTAGQALVLVGGVWTPTTIPGVPFAAQLDLYVSDVNGNDANDGLTPGTAVKTVTHAVTLFGDIFAAVVVHMGVHGGTGYAPPTIAGRTFHADLVFVGDGAGQPGDDGFTVALATEAAIAGSTASIIKTTSVLVTDAYRGKFVQILSGAAAGDIRQIGTNDTATLYPVEVFSAAVAATDTFRVVDPAVTWLFPTTSGANDKDFLLCSNAGAPNGARGSYEWGWSPAVYFVFQKWTNSGTARAGATIANSRVAGVGLVIDGLDSLGLTSPALNMGTNTEFCMGTDQISAAQFASKMVGLVTTLGVASATKLLGCGVTLRQGASQIWGGCQASGYIVAPMIIFESAKFFLLGGNIYGTGSPSGALACTRGTIGRIQGPSTTIPFLISNTHVSAGALKLLYGAQINTMLNVKIVSSGYCIEVYSGARISALSSTCIGTGAVFGAVVGAGGRIGYSSTVQISGPSGADQSTDYVTAVPNSMFTAFGIGTFNLSDGSCISRE